MTSDILKWSRANGQGMTLSKCGRFGIERRNYGSCVEYIGWCMDPSLSSTPTGREILFSCAPLLRDAKSWTQHWLNKRLEEIREEARRKAAETEAQWRDKDGIPNWDFAVE